MINTEWEELLGIEAVSGIPDHISASSTAIKKDAAASLAACLNELGYVDVNWMQEYSGLSLDELTETLEGAIYQDPEIYDRYQQEDQGWVLRPQYLSGNIKTKLDIAKKLNRRYQGRFASNIQALKSILPEKVELDQIGFGIGSPWIPEQYYSLFAKETLGFFCMPVIRFSPAIGRWHITLASGEKETVQNHYTYGTKRLSALQILDCTLNGGTVKVYDEVLRPERKSGVAKVLNKAETLAAQEKQALLQKAFQEWVQMKPTRVKRLQEIYYDVYVCHAAGHYSGRFLDLPGLNTEQFTPYPHQKDAVARIILEKDVLLNHQVGTGKTSILIMGMHERKRLGLSNRNLVVVPNNVLEAFEKTHQLLYPQDSILVVHPEDFRQDRRQKVLTKIREEDHVAVYMAFSSFERLGMSRSYRLDRQREKIRICRAKAASVVETWERSKLENAESRLIVELAKMEEELPWEEGLSFDELGITTLTVDEAHHFKNISLHTRTDGVVGMHAKGSKKCDEMWEKIQYVRNQGGSVILSTGTPLTNSIADLFVLQVFLQPEQLEFLHLNHFDEWINNFATRQTSFEVDVDSQNYRVRTRFSRFHNIPELASLFAHVCDFYTNDGSQVDLPECEGYTDVVVPKSLEQEVYLEELVDRTERIRQKMVREKEDNLLKVTHDGRSAALDIRLAEPTAEPDPEGTKAYACAQKIYELWKTYPDTAQLVFCDLGTPKKGFNLYDELKRMLRGMGVPANEIAFVHEAATDAGRRRLFESVNAASVRILIGSTTKLGTGVNVQKRLIGIHHLDIPWRPSDIVQREGRLIRQGNMNQRVFRFRYITAGTFDAYSWQLLENKQRFISQFMSNHSACRDVGDIDDTVLSYAEIKALSVGDPLLKTRIDTSNELERMRIQCRQREQDLRRFEKLVQDAPDLLRKLAERKQRLEQDLAHFLANRERMSKLDRKIFGEELLEELQRSIHAETERWFDNLHGFRILLPAYGKHERPAVVIQGASGNRYEVDMREAQAGGCVQRIEHRLSRLEGRIHGTEEEILRAKAQVEHAEAERKKGNPYTADVASLSETLLDIDEELNRRAQERET